MLGSIAAKNADLDASYGDNHSSEWDSSLFLRLYSGNPTSGGVELPATGGYAALALSNDSANWPDASAGQKANGATFDMPVSTGPWGAAATYWWLTDSSGNLLDGNALSSPIIVIDAGVLIYFPPGSMVIAA